MINRDPLAILVTGGTLDKVHDTFSESLILDGTSRVADILGQGRARVSRIKSLMSIDSLDMDDTHRAKILRAINTAPENRIVVTHGTGTMELTAQALDGNIGKKTVVLTGAMRPWSLGQSDGNFNLGGAVIAARLLPAGVYGVMNGKVFAAQDLHKDVASGRFD
ncbi:asparaginase domain-containing protein [Litorimonas sp. WD9-15]|uniref:asparaginase domain-containing protein n=1 Tax=Litorimonas sp. WD9-15 TaxID=3418716 RepID=UPI003D052374